MARAVSCPDTQDFHRDESRRPNPRAEKQQSFLHDWTASLCGNLAPPLTSCDPKRREHCKRTDLMIAKRIKLT